MVKKTVPKYLLLVITLLLSACAETPAVKPSSGLESAWERHSRELDRLQVWKAKGRLAIQADEDGWTASIHWDQDHDNYRIRLIAPLGQGTYELTGSDEGVVMTTADNRILNARNPERLLEDNLGWQVRLSGLRYWILGLPEPGVDAEQVNFDNEGRLSDMQQAGWRVSVLRYIDTGGLQLPGKLFMHNDRFKLRLVIHEWETKI
jgi:outer membrane lipoprotein LolB